MRKDRFSPAYEMERVIYPVGLGAFCRERFIKESDKTVVFDMVYDCGSLSRMGGNIRKEIQIRYSTRPIDLVCISHFDDDHINEFKKLLGTPIIKPGYTTILMPQIVAVNRVLVEIGVDEYVNYTSLVEELREGKHKIVEVRPLEGEVENIENNAIDFSELNGTIFSGTRIAILDRLWEYIPFNNFDRTYNINLINLLKQKTGFNDQQLEAIRNGYATQQDIAVLKKAYGKLGKTHNNVTFINRNSLQILSKAIYPVHSGGYIMYHSLWFQYNFSPICYALNSSCMYTGDSAMEMTMVAIKNKYLPYEDLGLFQIPHHGSTHCYNQRVIDNLSFHAAFVNTDLNTPKLSVAPELINWQNHNIPALFMALVGKGVICEYIY